MFFYAIVILLSALVFADENIDTLKKKLFDQFDTDNDDQLSQQEFYAYSKLFDTNKDNEISQEELKPAIANLRPDYNGPDQLVRDALDYNSDGIININDFLAFYYKDDENADDFIDRAEFYRSIERRLSKKN